MYHYFLCMNFLCNVEIIHVMERHNVVHPMNCQYFIGLVA